MKVTAESMLARRQIVSEALGDGPVKRVIDKRLNQSCRRLRERTHGSWNFDVRCSSLYGWAKYGWANNTDGSVPRQGLLPDRSFDDESRKHPRKHRQGAAPP